MDRWIIIGRRIKSARKEAKLTQVDLAVAIGVERSHLSKTERGRNGMAVEKMILIANETGATIDWLLGYGAAELSPEMQRQFEWNRSFMRMDPETRTAVLRLVRGAA